jgi:hypothetical protein
MKQYLQNRYVVPITEWCSTVWPQAVQAGTQSHEKISELPRSANSFDSRYHQADGSAARSAPLPRQMDAAAANQTRMAAGRTRLGANTRSRSTLRASTVPDGSWNITILCLDAAASERACRLLQDNLTALGLRVQCHVRQWQFVELSEPPAFESAVEHALDADLVVFSGQDTRPMSEDVQAVLDEWLIRSDPSASPLVVVLDSCGQADESGDGILATLEGLTDRAHVPLYTDFRDALLVAWSLWEWKHFPWVPASEEPLGCSRIDSLFDGQRHTAQHCRGASSRGAHAVTSRHALTVSRPESSVRRCQS